MTPKLRMKDLVAGLEQFDDRYLALDVFVGDVVELEQLVAGHAVPAFEPRTDGSFGFTHDGRSYNVRIFPDLGVARFMRAEKSPAPGGAAVGGAAGAMLGAVASKKGEEVGGAALGLLLGLLVGAAIGDPSPRAPRRVFAISFDPAIQRWRAYDGGLVRWLKQRLAPPEVLEELPLHT